MSNNMLHYLAEGTCYIIKIILMICLLFHIFILLLLHRLTTLLRQRCQMRRMSVGHIRLALPLNLHHQQVGQLNILHTLFIIINIIIIIIIITNGVKTLQIYLKGHIVDSKIMSGGCGKRVFY